MRHQSLLVLLLSLAGSLMAAPAPRPAVPNIVVIMADDMGYGDPRCYNADSKIPTPHMDRLAAEGIRFTDAHTPASVCTPTRYGLLTGRYSWRTRLKNFVLWTGYDEPLIEAERETVGSLLKRAGYRTAAVGKWHLGLNFAKPGGGFVRGKSAHMSGGGGTREVDFARPIQGGPTALGFDVGYVLPAGNNLEPHLFVAGDRVVGSPTVWRGRAVPTQPGSSALEVHEGWMTEGWSDEAIGPALTEQALEFIQQSAAKGSPFFLYFASPAPHRPSTPSKFAQGKSQAGVRGDMVYEFDWSVGRILAKLDELGVANNTLVVVTSDNGGVNKGDEGHDFGHKSCGDLKGFKGGLAEGGHRVPFLVRWPGRAPAGTTNASLVCLTDLMTTFGEVAGVKLPSGAAPDGISILPALLGAEMPADKREPVIHHSGAGHFAIRSGRWKLIFDADSKPVQLYDLERDLREETNVIKDHAELVGRLQQALQRIRESRS